MEGKYIQKNYVYNTHFLTFSRGQLGLGDLEDQEKPMLIEGLAGLKVKKIACGSWHSVAITQDGDMYVWGWNSNGQLGIKNVEDHHSTIQAEPFLLNFETVIIDVACGSRHTICLQSN